MPDRESFARIQLDSRRVRSILLVFSCIMVLIIGSSIIIRLRSDNQPDHLDNATEIIKLTRDFTAPVPSGTYTPKFIQPSKTNTISEVIKSLQPATGMVILALGEGGYSHLFAYQSNSPLIRLSDGPWSDITPSISPDGNLLTFASNRDGSWDLYTLNLIDGAITRITTSMEYDASPSFSPDNQWLAYESYVPEEEGGNLEIFIRPLDGSQGPIRLTNNSAADFSPVWSPGGREIAFISTRSGESEVWLADLDQTTDRFKNLSRDSSTIETFPAWSPDGTRLSWSSQSHEGFQGIVIWDSNYPEDLPIPVGIGEWSIWSPDEDILWVTFQTPNQSYFTAYNFENDNLVMPILSLDGSVKGIAYTKSQFSSPPPYWVQTIPQVPPTPLWNQVLISENLPGQRMEVVPLVDVEAPFPMLHDQVDESYQMLRARLANEIGWDFLATLEQAYVPLTSQLGPGMQEDWLYTARAFRFNTAPVNAGWVKIVRQVYGSQTFWLIYLKSLLQDGSQGLPLTSFPWSFEGRYSGEALAYEHGGTLEKSVPSGYWLNFTELALTYGWERLPALSSWLTAYSSARYNEFVLRNNLNWFTAMLEIYPREALNTATPISSPTPTSTASNTPTPTPTYTRTPYLSRTPTHTPTPPPTRTPRPTNTPWPTITSPPSGT